MTGVPLTEGPVQGAGMQKVGPLSQGPAHAPNLFPIPTAATRPPAGCGDRNLPLAGEGLTGLHRAVRKGSAAGTTAPCQASNGSCARRGNLGLGVSLPYEGVSPVCGVSTALDTRCSSGGCCGHTGLVPAMEHLPLPLPGVGLCPGCARKLMALVAT